MTVKCLLMACDYAGTPDELRGCQNDAKNLKEALVKSSVAAEHDITTVLEPTLCDMRDALYSLARSTHSEDVSHVLVTWSGHGSFQRDENGDELDGADECLCPIDFASSGGLLDDELCRIVHSINHATRVTLLLDCCHSGTAVDQPWVFTGLRRTEPAGKGSCVCHPHVIAISGCRDDQTSADAYDSMRNQFTGAMTCALLDCLRIEPTLIADAPSMVAAIRVLLYERKMTQYPQLSCSREYSTDMDLRVLPVP